MAQITKNQIIFDESDWSAGFAKNNAVKAVVNPSNQVVSVFDPFREYGIAEPGRVGANATNNSVLAGTMVSLSLKTSELAYGVDVGGKFHEYNYSTNTITNAGVFPQTLSGTTPVGQDTIIYKHNSGGTPVFSTFYSWYNTANWNVGCFVNFTGTPDEDFMSSIPATPLDITSSDGDDTAQKSAPHIMEVGADDILYIGSGRYLHAYDGATGTNGTFTARVLSLPMGFTITGLLRYQDKLLIAGVYTGATTTVTATNVGSAGEAMVYVWNYIDLDVTQSIPLDDPYVSSIFSWRGQICVITSGESEGFGTLTGTKLKMVIGSSAEKIAEFNGDVVHRGVDSSSRVLYINVSGKIYSIGDNIKDGYNVNHLMSCVSTSQAGFVKNLVGNVFLASSSTGSTHSMSKFSSSTYTSGYITTCYYPIENLPENMVAKVKNVRIEYYGTATNATVGVSATLSYDMGGGANDQTIVSNLRTVANPSQKIYHQDTSNAPFNRFSSVRLGLVWTDIAGTTSAVKISKVIINYELVALAG